MAELLECFVLLITHFTWFTGISSKGGRFEPTLRGFPREELLPCFNRAGADVNKQGNRYEAPKIMMNACPRPVNLNASQECFEPGT